MNTAKPKSAEKEVGRLMARFRQGDIDPITAATLVQAQLEIIKLASFQAGLRKGAEIATKDWGSDIMRNDILTFADNCTEKDIV